MNVWELNNIFEFDTLVLDVGEALLKAPKVGALMWQSQDISNKPEMMPYELMHTRLQIPLPYFAQELAQCTGANIPWAEDHFQERVSGKPLNPPPSEAWWPYAQQGNAAHKTDEKFSHTYPERFWPIFAAAGEKAPNGRLEGVPHQGIRYEYGDLDGVLRLLDTDLYTRQAYLPVWFPEDTGKRYDQRVPCTIGYHFMYRQDRLHIEYTIRSCDFMRHWRDDVYMAGRLCQWMCDQLGDMQPGKLVMNIGSFHIFDGDRGPLRKIIRDLRAQVTQTKYAKIAGAL